MDDSGGLADLQFRGRHAEFISILFHRIVHTDLASVAIIFIEKKHNFSVTRFSN